MAEQTKNYGFTKPSPEDFYDIGVQNINTDIIDAELKKTNDKLDNTDFAILEDAGDAPEAEIPTDTDLLGGHPASYFEQLVQAVGDRVTANLNRINAINSTLVPYLLPGTYINNNENLNDEKFWHLGKYYHESTDGTDTIENRPPGMDVAFTMDVVYATGSGYPCQIITAFNTGHTYRRINDPYARIITDWIQLF